MKAEKDLFLAVDIGGTKIAVGLIDNDGHILAYNQDQTCQISPKEGIRQIINMLESLVDQQRIQIETVTAIGIGIPAVLEPESDYVIWAPNLNNWRNVDLKGALATYFKLPVYIEYDGHAAVLGEWWVGAGRTYHTLVDIIIGTGVGGGMILDGKLFRGNNRLAGAAGWFGPSTCIGQQDERPLTNGYWESHVSGPAVTVRAKKLARVNEDSAIVRLATEERLSSITLFAAAKQGDQAAQKLCNQVADEIGSGIANVVSMINPQLVILGGGLGSNCAFLLPRIRKFVDHWAQPFSAQSVEIVISALGSQAGLLGAAYAAILRSAED
ncbi:MAG TPA: hypothetical protein DCK95_01540 [Anaerolineaceae bacterium]|nr:hypothetical protein [Anaerolineaceae bacterium]